MKKDWLAALMMLLRLLKGNYLSFGQCVCACLVGGSSFPSGRETSGLIGELPAEELLLSRLQCNASSIMYVLFVTGFHREVSFRGRRNTDSAMYHTILCRVAFYLDSGNDMIT